jgi:hypothetical protein
MNVLTKWICAAALVAASFTAHAQRTPVPVADFPSIPVPGKNLSAEQVGKAIVGAAADEKFRAKRRRDWQNTP